MMCMKDIIMLLPYLAYSSIVVITSFLPDNELITGPTLRQALAFDGSSVYSLSAAGVLLKNKMLSTTF